MEFIDFLDSATLHETFVFLAQNQCLSGFDPQKPKKTMKINDFPRIHQNFIIFRRIPGNSAKTSQNSFWRILVVPWPPHAENLVIPIGILRFLSLPGGLETLQNTKNGEISPNMKNSAQIMKFLKIS